MCSLPFGKKYMCVLLCLLISGFYPLFQTLGKTHSFSKIAVTFEQMIYILWDLECPKPFGHDGAVKSLDEEEDLITDNNEPIMTVVVEQSLALL